MFFFRTVISAISPLSVRRQSGLALLQHVKHLPGSRFSSTVAFQSMNSACPDNVESKRTSELSFDDHQEIFRNTSTSELVRRCLLFSFLKLGPVTRNSGQLFCLSNKILGKRLTNYVLHSTMFRQFCGGEDLNELMKRSKDLADHSMGTIIDYAAECDIKDGEEPTAAWLDKNRDVIKESIYNASLLTKCSDSPSFVAVKATSLCSPEFLRRVSRSLNFIHHLFAVSCGANPVTSHLIIPHSHGELANQVLSVSQFVAAVKGAWPSLPNSEIDVMFQKVSDMPGRLTPHGEVSYFQWTSFFSPEKLSALGPPRVQFDPNVTKSLKSCWVSGDRSAREWFAAKQRVSDISSYAKELKVRLLMDAEQSFFQPAVDLLAIDAMQEFNNASDGSVIYNTYQMYLKNTLGKLQSDCMRADNVGYKFGAKVVRGAYVTQERQVAEQQHYQSPLCESIEDTHFQYDLAVEMMISRLPKSELLVGTHNELSVKKAVRLLAESHSSSGTAPVSFGQLLGMCDHISLSLAQTGYRCFKYVPYGPIQLVMPYLIRRAEENSSVLGSTARELALMKREIRNRLSVKLLKVN